MVAQEVQEGSSTTGEGTAVQALVFSLQPQILPLQVIQKGVGTIGTQVLLLRGCYIPNVPECSFTVRLELPRALDHLGLQADPPVHGKLT